MILFQFHKKTDRNTINMKKFYGQDSTSWNGKYNYHRHGFLEDIPHRKILRGVVILRKQDSEKVLDFLGKYSLKLTPDDEEILRGFHE